MPVYNAKEDELRIAIESILKQTFGDFEFIIINDASTNNSEDIILSYKDKRIRYFKNEQNLKITATLNLGLELANGKYIARIDSDDFSEPTRFEKQVNFLNKNQEIGLVTSFYKIFPQENTVIMPTDPDDIEIITRYCKNPIVHSSVMFKKSILDENNLKYDKNCVHAEDHKLWSDMSRFCKIGVIPEILTHYRMSAEGISSTNINWQAKMVTVIILDNLIKDFPCDKNYMYTILAKYVKNEPVNEIEFNTFAEFLLLCTRYLTLKISIEYNKQIKNYILSILKFFIRK